MDSKDKRYSYDQFGVKAARAGQAVVDILSKPQPSYTAGEILDGYQHSFVKELEDTIQNNVHKYDDPFYIFVLSNKEMWADNLVRNWFIARQTPPFATDMIVNFPNHVKILYKIQNSKMSCDLLWTIPGMQDISSIRKSPEIYDAQLVNWISEALNGKLDKDSY